MVISNNLDFIRKIKQLKAFGIDTDIKNRKMPGMYDVRKLGFNYRMTDFQAAIGYYQLKDLKKFINKKKNAKLYQKHLTSKFIQFKPYDKNCSYFIYQIFVKKEMI